MTEVTIKEDMNPILASDAAGFFDDAVVPADKLRIPLVTLLQSNSERVTVDGDKQGTFFNSITKKNYGEVLDFIPIKFNYGAAYLTLDRGLVCKSADGITSIYGDICRQCPHGEYYKNWKDKKTPARCGETVDVFGLEGDTLQPCVVSFKSKSYPAGIKLATSCKLVRKLLGYKIGSRLDSNEKGKFFVIDPKTSYDVSEQQIIEALRWKDVFNRQKVEVQGEAHDTQHAD